MKTTVVPLKPGIAGTRQTLATMRVQVEQCIVDPEQRVRAAAVGILHQAGAAGGVAVAEATAFFDWIAWNPYITYRHDHTDVEYCQHPSDILRAVELKQPIGADCNNQAGLFASLGHCVRLPIWWVLVGDSPDAYRHIYPALDLRPGATATSACPLGPPENDADLLALDTAVPEPVIGRHACMGARWIVPAMEGL